MEKDLFKLIALTIPEAKPVELGFLDVVVQTTRENTINNVYRYFLDPEQSPVLSKLMVNTLLERIEERYKSKNQQKDTMLWENKLDALVFHFYGLNEADMNLILDTFKDLSIKDRNQIQNEYWNVGNGKFRLEV